MKEAYPERQPFQASDEGREEPDGGEVTDLLETANEKARERTLQHRAIGGAGLRLLEVTPMPPPPVARERKQRGAKSHWDRMKVIERRNTRQRVSAADNEFD